MVTDDADVLTQVEVQRPHGTPRRRLTVVGAVLGSAALGLGALFLNGSHGNQVSTVAMPAAPVSPTATASPVPTPTLDKAAAKAALQTYLVAVKREVAVKHVPNSRRTFDTVAASAELADLEAQQSELDADGWTRKGDVVVENLTVLSSKLNGKTPTVVAEGCFDSRGVTTYDSKGLPISSSNKSAERSLNTVTFEQHKGKWLVTQRAFPQDPAC